MNSPLQAAAADGPAWPREIFDRLRAFGVRQVAYVPDGGHKRLIELATADPAMHAICLTTEEEGVALVTGAWLGGDRSVLLMQSSGVGNCVNMFSLIRICKIPMLMLVTMRGEWGEFNPWQVPMGSTTEQVLSTAGIATVRADAPAEVDDVVRHAAAMAFEGGTATAVLLSQRLVGAKVFKDGGTSI